MGSQGQVGGGEEEMLIQAAHQINLEGTKFGNEKHFFLIHNSDEPVWF